MMKFGILSAALLSLGLTTTAPAQQAVWRPNCASGRCSAPQARTLSQPVKYRPYYAPAHTPAVPRVTPAVPMATVVVRPSPSSPAPVTYTADPLAHINGYRARHGLRPLAWDANLAAWASVNNQHQSRRGLGHHQLAGRRQNAVATADPSRAASIWYASAPHRLAMLDPNMTSAGAAYGWGYGTINFQ